MIEKRDFSQTICFHVVLMRILPSPTDQINSLNIWIIKSTKRKNFTRQSQNQSQNKRELFWIGPRMAGITNGASQSATNSANVKNQTIATASENPIESWPKEKKLEKLATYSACQVNHFELGVN